MTTEFITVTPTYAAFRHSARYHREQSAFSSGHQRTSKLVGAITRTDLLRVLHVDVSPDGPEIEPSAHPSRKRIINASLKERLTKPLVALLKDIGRVADDLGYNVYAVGGFVRDIFLRFETLDIDIVVEGDGIKFARAFAAAHHGKLERA